MSDSLLPVVEAGEVPVRNAWCLLLYAWDMAQWRGKWDGAAEVETNLRGLLARVLVDSTQALLRRHLRRAYGQTSFELRGIRGRVDFAKSLKKLSFEGGRAICVYPELSVDTLANRVLRSTLDSLLRNKWVAVGARREQAEALRHDLRAAVRAMDGVGLRPIQAADFGRLRLGRNDVDYALPIAICRLLFRHDIPSEEAGGDLFAGLLRDEMVFHELFERFVRNFYRFHFPEARVEAEELSWFDEEASPFVPRMKTDITIEWTPPVSRRLVIDTKYYGSALNTRYANAEKFHSANLYQLYAYLRTQEHRGASYRDASGMLLYPVTHRRLDERMRVQGHEIRVKTIDLALPWSDLEHDLLQLLAAPAGASSELLMGPKQ